MSTTVKMKQPISGRRNGKFWPEVGETIEVTDREATELEHMGIAERVKSTSKSSGGS
jgi:hypothetical protein